MSILKFSKVLLALVLMSTYAYSQDSAIVKLSPAEIQSYIEQAEKSIENQSYDAAIEKLDAVLKSDENNDNKKSYLEFNGTSIKDTAKHNSTLNKENKSLEKDAKDKAKDRDYNGCIEDFTNAVFLANKALDKISERDAKVAFRQEIAKIYLNRGIAKMHTESNKYFKLAVDDFDEAFKLDRDNFDIYIHRAEAFNALKDYNKELFDLRRLINEMNNPKSPLREKIDIAELYFKYAEVHINSSNDKDTGCKYYKKALNLGYTDAEKGVKRHCKF